MKSLSRKVDSFDGQTITIDGKSAYELGGFLGGGAAGVVYEGADVSEDSHVQPVAIKILNPIGFRLAPEDTLRRCVVARRGRLPSGYVQNGTTYSAKTAGGVLVGDQRGTGMGGLSSAPGVLGSGAETAGGSGAIGSASSRFSQNGSKHVLGPEHVWWLVSPNTKQVLAAYIDPRYGNLVELPLPKCIEIWGYNPQTDFSRSSSSSGTRDNSSAEGSSMTAAVTSGDPNLSASSAGVGSPNNNASSHPSRVFSSVCREGERMPGSAGGPVLSESRREDHGRVVEGSYDTSSNNDRSLSGPDATVSGTGGVEVQVDGMGVSIPWVPPKFVQWLAQRRKVRREICNMRRVGDHKNVVKLISVLEFLQDSKSTLFLILELVAGGELLDHIRPMAESSYGSRSRVGGSALRAEGSMQRYFGQLLSGLSYCHRQGVCHRDLSPSNLLLAESSQRNVPPELKIADFGLSACCAVPSSGNENLRLDDERPGEKLPLRVTSIVGSPHYMAPEVSIGSATGYDGFKADAWSCGVVLYTMLTASLPFGRELARCPRYKKWRKWADKNMIGAKKSTGSSVPSSLSSSTGFRTSPDSSSFSNITLGSGVGHSTMTTAAAGKASSSTPSTKAAVPTAAAGAPPSPAAPPQWLFPSSLIPPLARSLLVGLLTPDPKRRISVDQAAKHPYLFGVYGGTTWDPSRRYNSTSVNIDSTNSSGIGGVAKKQQPSDVVNSAVDFSAPSTGVTNEAVGVSPDATAATPAAAVQTATTPSTEQSASDNAAKPGAVGVGGGGSIRRVFATEWKSPWEIEALEQKKAAEAARRREQESKGGGITPEGAFDLSFAPTTSFP